MSNVRTNFAFGSYSSALPNKNSRNRTASSATSTHPNHTKRTNSLPYSTSHESKLKNNLLNRTQGSNPISEINRSSSLGFEVPTDEALIAEYYIARNSEFSRPNEENMCTSDSTIENKSLVHLLSRLESHFNPDNQAKKASCSLFCPDIIEQQIGYCVNNESIPKNIIKEKYWKHYTRTMIHPSNQASAKQYGITSKSWNEFGTNDKFENSRIEALKYGLFLQHRLEHSGESFLIASCMFDQFFQNMFRRQSFEDISQFTSLEFQYLIVSVCVLLASKYDEIYPAPVEDFIYLLGLKKTENFPDGITVDRNTFLTVEKKILVSNDWNFSKATGLTYLRILTIAMGNNGACHDISKFLLDSIYINSSTCHFSPSAASAMSVMLAREILSIFHENPGYTKWSNLEKSITGYSENDPKVQQALETIIKFALSIIKSSHAPKRKAPLQDMGFINKYKETVWKTFKDANVNEYFEQNLRR